MSAPAAGGAKEQVARLLALVPFLRTRGEVRLDDAARALGIGADQLLRDLRVLLMCGLPGGYPGDLIDVDLDALEDPEGDGVIRVSNADYLARPLRLTPTEASALILALRALREASSPDAQPIVDRVLAKLEVAAAEGAAGRVDVGGRTDDQAALRAALAAAAEAGRQVRLLYYVPTRDEESERVVDPRGVVQSGGFSYLDAWCHSAEAARLFRLDRIHAAEVLDSPVATPNRPPRELGDWLFRQDQDATRAVLLLAPAAGWVAEYYPVEKVRRRKGGFLEVTMLVADPQWLVRLLLRLSPDVRVLEPAEVAASHAEAVAATLRLYDPAAL